MLRTYVGASQRTQYLPSVSEIDLRVTLAFKEILAEWVILSVMLVDMTMPTSKPASMKRLKSNENMNIHCKRIISCMGEERN